MTIWTHQLSSLTVYLSRYYTKKLVNIWASIQSIQDTFYWSFLFTFWPAAPTGPGSPGGPVNPCRKYQCEFNAFEVQSTLAGNISLSLMLWMYCDPWSCIRLNETSRATNTGGLASERLNISETHETRRAVYTDGLASVRLNISGIHETMSATRWGRRF